jgi:glyoxylase-like metal-dependent hydrolase (beta-lactamase superfamily II)
MRHARLEQVAPGAWAAIALPDRGAVSNSGIVDLGGEALVFDTNFDPGAARELRAAAEELAGPVRIVVNSHWHGDHVRGNAVFEGATILATARTRELIATLGEERLRELKAAGGDEELAEYRKRGLVEEVALLEEFLAALPGLEQRLPDEEWEGRRDLGRAQLLTWGGGHTDSDAVLWLPEERVLFTGDLLFAGSQPWVGAGHPERWLELLDRIEELEPGTLVPGHGPVTDASAVATLRDYLGALLEDTDEAPERFAALDGAMMWERNVTALRERATKSAS